VDERVQKIEQEQLKDCEAIEKCNLKVSSMVEMVEMVQAVKVKRKRMKTTKRDIGGDDIAKIQHTLS
jgi:hypothetical protein